MMNEHNCENCTHCAVCARKEAMQGMINELKTHFYFCDFLVIFNCLARLNRQYQFAFAD